MAAKTIVERAAEHTLASEGLQDAPRFSVPMPFNTLLWRVVVMTPDGFLEGDRSLVADRGPMIFRRHASDRAALEAVAGYPSVRRLDWFTHGFLKAERRDGRLVLSDLRMNPTTYSAMLSPKATGREAGVRSPSNNSIALSGSLPLGWNLATNLEGTKSR